MTRILKPKALKKGGVIGICSPASPLSSTDALDASIRYVEQLGYRVELAPNLFRKRGYLAGSDRQRTDDLHSLFRNKHVNIIIVARGGYGTHRILPLLDYDLIRKHPKLVVGYSDITALQLALFTKASLMSVSGAMMTELPKTFGSNSEEMYWQAITSPRPLSSIKGKHPFGGKTARHATGRILGGNLSLISALAGTSFFPSSWKNRILLLEEIDERPYRIDRMLQQLQLNGTLDDLSGILLGDFGDCLPLKNKPSLLIDDVFRDAFGKRSYPVLNGFRYGHISKSLTFPIGVQARLASDRRTLQFLESAVQ